MFETSSVVGDGEIDADFACHDAVADVSTEDFLVDSVCGDYSFDIGGLCAWSRKFTQSDYFLGHSHVS